MHMYVDDPEPELEPEPEPEPKPYSDKMSKPEPFSNFPVPQHHCLTARSAHVYGSTAVPTPHEHVFTT
jgi:hypothetical protein